MSRIVAQPCNLDDTPGINFKKTVAKKVQLSLAKNFLPESEYSNLEQIYPDGTFRVWGVTPNNESRWNKISDGDVVLFYHAKEIFSTAKITYKIHNQELANNYWEPHTINGPFEFIYFLNEFKYYNLPISGSDGYNHCTLF
jgi:hypothetical protein